MHEFGKLECHTAAETSRRCIELIGREQGRMRSITADSGTEFHDFRQIEAATAVPFYVATPHQLAVGSRRMTMTSKPRRAYSAARSRGKAGVSAWVSAANQARP